MTSTGVSGACWRGRNSVVAWTFTFFLSLLLFFRPRVQHQVLVDIKAERNALLLLLPILVHVLEDHNGGRIVRLPPVKLFLRLYHLDIWALGFGPIFLDV